DIAFLGAVIHHILDHGRWFKEYVLAYTNAAVIIEEGFRDTEDLEGLFSGFDEATRTYDPEQGGWSYEGLGAAGGDVEQEKAEPGTAGIHGYGLMGAASSGGAPRLDPTLTH